jgi:predicted DsbA family dithiol-disulfide isomerase
MELDIFSDTICPWCLIGKRRLERALAQRPQPDLKIRWRAFQLNPDMPAAGMDRKLYLATKFGGPENASSVYDRIREAGASEGIDFDFDGIGHTPNTVDSHRLIRFADRNGCQDAVVEGLFQAYFLNGRNIGDREVLVSIAAANGLNAEATENYLATTEDADAIRAEDAQARAVGINGVPCFIFNGRHALPGAQSPEVFFQLFDLAREERKSPVTV